MTTASPEAKELALLEKVELKIALTNTDAKLQSVLATYLPPLLLKLASEHISVRNKVISICQHINTRTKPENIQLPVTALLKQFKQQSDSPLLHHFDLQYIQLGAPRLTSSDRAALLPVLASGISELATRSITHSSSIFNLLLRTLAEHRLPPKGSPEDLVLRASLEIGDDDASFLATWIGKLVLFRSSVGQESGSVLSQDDQAFLTLQGRPDVWNPSSKIGLNLAAAKLNGLQLLGSGAFKDDERLLPGLFASADANSRIADLGETLLKSALASVDTNNTSMLSQLYDLYDASLSLAPLRTRILNLLAKNTNSTAFPDRIIRIADRDLVRDTTRSDREATKLQNAIVQLLTFVAKNSSSTNLELVSKSIVTKLKDFLDQQLDDISSPDVKALRGRCFEVLGLLAGSNAGLLVEPELQLLRWLFRSLAEEKDKDVVFSIDEAISGTIRPFQSAVAEEIQENLKALLLDVLSLDSVNPRNTRFACIRFVNRCLPFHDVTARWIDISVLGTASTDSNEILEEARKGLDPYWHQLSSNYASQTETVASTNESTQPPDFAVMVHYVFDKGRMATSGQAQQLAAVSFCRKCLYWSCVLRSGAPIDSSADWDRKMDVALTQDQDSRKQIRLAIAGLVDDDDPRMAMLLILRHSLESIQRDIKFRGEYANVASQLLSLSPNKLVADLAPEFRVLQPALLGNDLESRVRAAQSFGVLASHPSVDTGLLRPAINELLHTLDECKQAIGQRSNQVHGSLLGLAYFVSRRVFRGVDDEISRNVIEKLLPHVVDLITKDYDALLQEAAFQALGQLCLFSVVGYDTLVNQVTYESLLESLAKASKSGKEKAIAAIGHLSLILDEEHQGKELENILEKLRALHDMRQPESQFVVGEALCCVGFGWDSRAVLPNIDIEGPLPQSKPRSHVLTTMLDTVWDDSRTTKPAMRKASVIWLLCFLQFGADRAEIQSYLPKFQAAFKRCLSDRDDLVQESASRGLGLVYEKGSRDLKDDLVRDLVQSFSGDKADISGTVTEDTQLFEPGALPTGDGSVTTYKDIMSLAAEVGDSSLVYRFMSLASNNAIWSSRAAFGKFGLSNVLSDSSVDGYLANNPKLYPKLYRYRFDPNSNVRRSMNDIWNALVKDTAATISTHFDAIVDDLLVSLVGREWRARQASCAALADIIQGQKLTKVQPHLSQIWTLCYKVLDDIKSSVRKAAGELARVLSTLLVRNLESSEGKSDGVEELLKIVLPFLLSTSGLESSAKDVQAFSLHTLLEIIKKGKPKNLRPFVPELVQQLIGLLSTFEHEAVNYMSLNSSNYGLQQSDIDDYRLKSIRSSPLMEAIERCLDMLDDNSMEQLSTKVIESMKTAVGVPSKVGISRVLVSLSTRRNFLFRPFANSQLVALRKQVVDRNETVSSSYAASIGYVSRLATDEQLLKTIEFVKQLYFGGDESDRLRYVAGEIIQAIARQATDRFNALASDILPFVFFGRFDDEKRVREIFKETYEDTANGPRAATLYLKEITKLATDQMSSKRWTFKHAAALAICEAVKAVASSNTKISEEQGSILWPPLQSALAEKSWDGKEKVLDGFVLFVDQGGDYCRSHDGMDKEVAKISLREARRRNKDYQPAALACLGKIAKLVPSIDMFADTLAIAKPILDEAEEKMQIDAKDDKEDKQEELVRSALEAMFGAVTGQVENGKDLGPRATALIDFTRLALRANVAAHSAIHAALFTHFRSLLVAALQHPSSLNQILLDPQSTSGGPSPFSAALANLLTTKEAPLQPPIQETPRLLRAEALMAYAEALVNDKSPRPITLLPSLVTLIDHEKSTQIRAILYKSQKLLKDSE